MNRSDFVERLLKYYLLTNFQHCLSILDSSVGWHADQVRSFVVKARERGLDVELIKCPGKDTRQALKILVDNVHTPYAVCLSDDDFLVPSGLEKCLHFLLNNDGYVAAQGKAVVFELNDSGPYGRFKAVGCYRLGCAEEKTAGDRLQGYLQNYFVNVFSLVRVECWRKISEAIELIPENSMAAELWPGAWIAVTGKVRQLNVPYLVRHVHDRRPVSDGTFKWFVESYWAESYRIISPLLRDEIIRLDHIGREIAEERVQQAFWALVIHLLSAEYYRVYEKRVSLRSRMLEMVRDHPALFSSLRAIKTAICGLSEYSLQGILRHGSSWQKDFSVVRDVVIGDSF